MLAVLSCIDEYKDFLSVTEGQTCLSDSFQACFVKKHRLSLTYHENFNDLDLVWSKMKDQAEDLKH